MMDHNALPGQESGTAVTLTIDGKKITAAFNQTVLEAATENGIYIPTLCYLKKLSPIGSCRVCLVEVEGKSQPLAACQLPVAEGMAVTTQSERLTEARRTMVQLILVNHPLDCPVCERSGECRLQNITVELGITQQAFKATPIERRKHRDWGVVRYNPELCVLCERCVRACNEVQGVAAYRVDRRGYHSVIDTRDGRPLNCDFCGQCIAVCPVGALSSNLMLQARSWEFEKINTVCPFCGTGCAMVLDVKKDRIYRVSSNPELGINQGNLCAKGRFGFQFVDSAQRVQTPLIRQNGHLTPASWDEALSLVADKLQSVKKQDGGKAIAGLGSERLPNEDNYLFQKFFKKTLGSNLIDTLGRGTNPGAAAVDPALRATTDDLLAADLILTLGAEPAEENPVIGNLMRIALRSNNATLITLFDRRVRFKPQPHIQLSHAHGQGAALVKALATAAAGADPGRAVTMDVAGVCSATIAQAGLKLKQAKSAVILCGRDGDAQPWLAEAAALCSAINGKILFYSEYCNSRGAADMGLRPEPGSDIFEAALAGKLKALYIMGEDPVTRHRSGNLVRKALQKIDFIVVQDLYLTPAAEMAHVVLPSATFAEREGTFTNMEGRVQRLRRAITPRGDARPDWQILALLEKRLAGSFNYDSAEDIFKEIAGTLPAYKGMSYARLGTQGVLASYGPAGAKTVQPEVTPVVDTGDKERPFILLEGNSFFHLAPLSLRSPALLGLEAECRAEINPQDAAGLSVADGDLVTVASAEGSLTVKVRVTDKILPGTVLIPQGFESAPANVLRPAQRSITRVNITKTGRK